MTKRVIINADDFGQSYGVNLGIAKAHDEGILTSASLMVHWPMAAEASEYARERPHLGVGLHFDLGEWKLNGTEWVPIYQRVDTADETAVARELNRQFERFSQLLHFTPTHIDSHQHLHMREPVRSVVNEFAAHHRIPVRGRDTIHCGKFYGQDEFAISHPDWISVAALCRLLRQLTDEITEIGCHPAALCDLDTMYSAERITELRTLCDPQLKNVVAELGIELVHFGMIGPAVSHGLAT